MRKQAAFMFFLRVLRMAFSVINLSLSARYFGVSLERDIWLLALSAILIFDMAIWGPVNETFRAKFLFIRQDEGEATAINKAKGLIFFINICTLLLVVLILLFPGVIAKVIAPGYEEEKLQQLIFMIRVVAPTFMLNQLNKILASVLNTYNSFIIPEVTGMVSQIITFILLLSLAPTLGIVSLAISYYIGILLLLLTLILQVRHLKVPLFANFREVDLTGISTFLMYSLPFFLPYMTAQVNLVVEKGLASASAVGAVSVVDYSRKFSDIPLEVLSGIFAAMLVPVLSTKFAKKNQHDFLEEFRKIYQFGFLIVTAIVGLLTACPHAFVSILYSGGSITQEVLSEISSMTRFYSWAAAGIFLYLIFGFALLASNKGKLYAIYGTMAQVLMIAINLSCYANFGIAIFPWALLLSHLLAAVIMACYFPVPAKRLRIISFKYALVLVCVATLMYFINLNFGSIVNPFYVIILNGILLVALLLGAMRLLKLEERLIIVHSCMKIINNFK